MFKELLLFVFLLNNLIVPSKNLSAYFNTDARIYKQLFDVVPGISGVNQSYIITKLG